uniref:Uncharacterized protein n=1 Tax=Lygus hesperus TaxID=30085 RepID=A0A146LEB2_LYGHE
MTSSIRASISNSAVFPSAIHLGNQPLQFTMSMSSVTPSRFSNGFVWCTLLCAVLSVSGCVISLITHSLCSQDELNDIVVPSVDDVLFVGTFAASSSVLLLCPLPLLHLFSPVRPPNLRTIHTSLERLKLPVNTVCNLVVRCHAKACADVVLPHTHTVMLSIHLQSLTCSTVLHYECLLLLKEVNQVCISYTEQQYEEHCALLQNIHSIEHPIPISKLLPLFRVDDISCLESTAQSAAGSTHAKRQFVSSSSASSSSRSMLPPSYLHTSLILTTSGVIKRSLEQQHSLTRLVYVPRLLD